MDSVQQLVAERGAAYGPPAENHTRTAYLWSAYLRSRYSETRPVTPDDVCFMNILQKVARCMSQAGPGQDSLEDIKGFAENILIMHGYSKPSSEKCG
jgi:hypothetical protein